MKTSIQNPEILATDGTRIKHRHGKGAFYKEAKKAGSKEPNVGGCGKGQVGRRVCRATTGQRGRKTSELTRLMGTQPAQPASTRFNYFMRDERNRIPGRGMIGRGIRPVDSEDARSYVRNITGFSMCKSLIFQKIPRFYAQIRPVFTRFYAFLRVGACFKTMKGAVFFENPPGGRSFGRGRRWLSRYSPLRGCSDLAALATAKISRRSTLLSFQAGSRLFFRCTGDFWPAMEAWLGRWGVRGLGHSQIEWRAGAIRH